MDRSKTFCMQRFINAAIVIFLVPLLVHSQAPRPEIQKLARYLGRWNYEGEDKTPVTGGPVTCTSTRRWISGGFFVESHRDCKTPRGEVTQVEVYGYDFQNRVYTYWGFNSSVV